MFKSSEKTPYGNVCENYILVRLVSVLKYVPSQLVLPDVKFSATG